MGMGAAQHTRGRREGGGVEGGGLGGISVPGPPGPRLPKACPACVDVTQPRGPDEAGRGQPDPAPRPGGLLHICSARR